MNENIFRVLRHLEGIAADGGTGQKFWNVPPETGRFLNMLVRAVGARTVLEIGTSNGYSGLWFAEALSHTGGELYTVESHRERFELARRNFEEAGVGEYVRQIFGHAPEVFGAGAAATGRAIRPQRTGEIGLGQPGTAAITKQKYDLIFLDATKMEYESYLEVVLPLLRDGGVLLADNMLSHERETAGFFAVVQQKTELDSAVLPLGTGLLVAAKSL